MNINTFVRLYEQLTPNSLSLLSDIYHPQVVFEDPAHRLEGLESVERYFQHLFTNLYYCQFEIETKMQVEHQGFVTWCMTFAHPKLKNGAPIRVMGASHIRFQEERVIYHRDYFDLGAMLYENMPLIGYLLQRLKQRLKG